MLKKMIYILLAIIFAPVFYGCAFALYISTAVIPVAVILRLVSDALGWQNPMIYDGIPTLISLKGALIIVLLLILAVLFFFLARLSMKLAHFFIRAARGK